MHDLRRRREQIRFTMMGLELAYGRARDIIGRERAECLEAAVEVERLRRAYLPERVRVVVLAESHIGEMVCRCAPSAVLIVGKGVRARTSDTASRWPSSISLTPACLRKPSPVTGAIASPCARSAVGGQFDCGIVAYHQAI
jgi:hypothetical protein